MLNIILFGPPGAGKGTQSEKLIQQYQLIHIAPGDLLREQISRKTALGNQVAQYINEGKLAPDALVVDVVAEQLAASNEHGFLFDGFPRTAAQAAILHKKLAAHNLQIDAAFLLEVPETELRKRLQVRAKLAGRVDDQDDAKIDTRMRVYNNETFPVTQYYDQQSKLFKIDGTGGINEIFGRITTVLNSLSHSLNAK